MLDSEEHIDLRDILDTVGSQEYVFLDFIGRLFVSGYGYERLVLSMGTCC